MTLTSALPGKHQLLLGMPFLSSQHAILDLNTGFIKLGKRLYQLCFRKGPIIGAVTIEKIAPNVNECEVRNWNVLLEATSKANLEEEDFKES